jgi:hypothetical protein
MESSPSSEIFKKIQEFATDVGLSLIEREHRETAEIVKSIINGQFLTALRRVGQESNPSERRLLDGCGVHCFNKQRLNRRRLTYDTRQLHPSAL